MLFGLDWSLSPRFSLSKLNHTKDSGVHFNQTKQGQREHTLREQTKKTTSVSD